MLDEAVNKCAQSTGETGEFATENVGFGSNPGAPPPSVPLFQPERTHETRTPANLENTDEGHMGRGRQQNSRPELGRKEIGFPSETKVFYEGETLAKELILNEGYSSSAVRLSGDGWFGLLPWGWSLGTVVYCPSYGGLGLGLVALGQRQGGPNRLLAEVR